MQAAGHRRVQGDLLTHEPSTPFESRRRGRFEVVRVEYSSLHDVARTLRDSGYELCFEASARCARPLSNVASSVIPKKKVRWSAAWQEARALIWARRGGCALGLVADARQPAGRASCCRRSRSTSSTTSSASSASICSRRWRWPAARATVVQAVTSFALSQILGVAAQTAITDMRRRVEEHVAAPAGPLLRLDADRRADLARHERRRRHPQSRRHRPRPADRQRRHGGRRARRSCSI